jgi:osmotically-inducible protein OsmY
MVAAVLLLVAAGCQKSPKVEPRGPERYTDADIVRAVEDELVVNDGVSSHLVDVSAEKGVVTLTGSVDNLLEHDMAMRIARSVWGVRSVIDRMEVRTPEVPDHELAARVRASLAADPATDAYEVRAGVDDGVVSLAGEVDSWAERLLCGEVVRGVKGVKEVANRIVVDPDLTRPDAEITSDIERRYELDPRIPQWLIDVEVADGVVRLVGAVGNAMERTRARDAAYVLGVEQVDIAELKTEAWARDEMRRGNTFVIRKDTALEKAVRDALLYDPRTNATGVRVTADEGVVELGGSVASLDAKRAAEQDARNTVGVWKVRNELRVRPDTLPTDRQLENRVNEALRWDARLERHEIEVTVRNAKVYLHGAVDSHIERNRASRVASRIGGVVAVDNRLVVERPRPWHSDSTLEELVGEELRWSQEVDHRDIAVTVEEGRAVLDGSVNGWHELHAAIDNAFEAGAVEVEPRLEVEGMPEHAYPVYSYQQYYYHNAHRRWYD